jgi:putative membrane protein insertion efficiency factor
MSQIARTFMLGLLRGYKWAISPLLPPACRYVPTCSDYAMEAVERYGLFRGSLMATARVLRCHPFAKGGYDPVLKCVGAISAVDNSVVEKPRELTPAGLPPTGCVVTE